MSVNKNRMVLVVGCFFCYFFFCFVAAIFDLVQDVEAVFLIPYLLHLEIFSKIRVMPVKLQIAVSGASLIFQKDFQMLISINIVYVV